MAVRVNELFTAESSKVKLRKYQEIYLYILSQAEGPLSKAHILRLNRTMRDPNSLHRKPGAKEYDYTFVDAVGSADPEYRKINEGNEGYLSLVSLGYVRCRTITIEEMDTPVYEITEEGRKALLPHIDRIVAKYFTWEGEAESSRSA